MQAKRRLLLEHLVALSVLVPTAGCVTVNRESVQRRQGMADSVVDAAYNGAAGELRDGLPHFRTLEQALNAAPTNWYTPWRIALRPGRYREKVEITKPNIYLYGDQRDRTVITFDAYSGQTRPSGAGTWTTFGCATLIVRAPGFAATNLTIENSYDYLANDAKAPTDPTYSNDPQAVALMLAKGSDRAQLNNVTISGYQDTLFVDAGRNYFRDCLVSGNVDFIFGAGQPVFDACDIVSRPRRKPNVAPANSHALGRPWHPAATFPDGRYADPNAVGSSVFIECFMDDHIAQDGWWSMTGLQKSGPTRTVFHPEDSRFFEYRSHGPGAALAGNGKRRQLSDSEAMRYTVAEVLGDWPAGPR